MSDFSRKSSQIARKDYICDECTFLCNIVDKGDLMFDQLRAVATAKREAWKIKKGQRYLKWEGRIDGIWTTYRARPEIHEICIAAGYYRE